MNACLDGEVRSLRALPEPPRGCHDSADFTDPSSGGIESIPAARRGMLGAAEPHEREEMSA